MLSSSHKEKCRIVCGTRRGPERLRGFRETDPRTKIEPGKACINWVNDMRTRKTSAPTVILFADSFLEARGPNLPVILL